jgi:membrane protease YdiL (CAAX protease family)
LTFLDYAARGKTRWWRYVATLVLGPSLALALALAVTLPISWLHLLPADFREQILGVKRPEAFFLMNGALFGAVLLSFTIVLALIHGKRFRDVVGDWTWRALGRGLGLWAIALVLMTLVDLALAPSGFTFTATSRTPALAAAAFVGLGLQSFTEEFLFRGYLTQGLLLAVRRPAVAAAIGGLLFGAIHIPNGWPQAADAVVFGVVTALIAIRMGGFVFTFGMHLVNNLFGAVLVVSSGDVFSGAPGVFSQNTPQLSWWDAAFTAVALVVVGVLVLRRAKVAPVLQVAKSSA